MPTFDYSAYNASGKLVRGIISAESERLARKTLKEKHEARTKAAAAKKGKK